MRTVCPVPHQADRVADVDHLRHGMYAPPFGLSVWPRKSDEASDSRKIDRVGDLVRPAEPPERHVAQPAPALLGLREVGGHLGHREARRHGVDADAAGPELARRASA